MEQINTTGRRLFLKRSATGAAALGIGIAAMSTFATGCNEPGNKDKGMAGTENTDTMAVAAKEGGDTTKGREYFDNIIPIVALSNKMCEMAKNKANGKYVKEFAKFELEETDTVKQVLKEMGTDAPPIDAEGKAKLDKLDSLSGAEYDRMFIQEQIDGHNKLIDHANNFLNGTENNNAEMHNRHIAMMARATHKEHVAICNRLKEEGMNT